MIMEIRCQGKTVIVNQIYKNTYIHRMLLVLHLSCMDIEGSSDLFSLKQVMKQGKKRIRLRMLISKRMKVY